MFTSSTVESSLSQLPQWLKQIQNLPYPAWPPHGRNPDENDRSPRKFWMQWDANLRKRGFVFDFEQPTHVTAPRGHIFAKRLSDNQPLLVKYVCKYKFPQEGTLVEWLIAEPARSHPHNKTPYIDVIDVGREAWLLVSPLCGSISSEPFPISRLRRSEDFLDFFEQITQALDFLHSNGIAHCDIYCGNLLMGLPAQRPYQWHLIDFGSAVSYDPTDPLAAPPLIDRKHRTARRDCPDYRSGASIDPFAFDVYCWGHWIRHICEEVELDFPALKQLAKEMTFPEPHLRLSSETVLLRLTRDVSDLRVLLTKGMLPQEVSRRWPKGPNFF